MKVGAFTTRLKLGGTAYVVQGSLDPYVTTVTVGQIRVQQTHPKACGFDGDKAYQEIYMCFETGVGSGTLWECGKNIFANEADAQQGVIARQQEAYKQRALRDRQQAEETARRRESDLATLERLKAKYETPAVAA